MRAAAPLLALLLLGCVDETPVSLRDEANLRAQALQLSEHLEVRVEGAVITGRTEEEGKPRVFIRAQSLDARIDVLDTGCEPVEVELEVDQLPAALIASRRAFRGEIAPQVMAAQAASEGAFGWIGDPHDPDLTPLEEERLFDVSRDGKRARWTARLDRSRETVSVVPGFKAQVALPEPGACAHLETAAAGLGRAGLVLRHRLRARVEGEMPIRFAVWGNNAGDAVARRTLVQAINADAAIEFLILGGDLIARGGGDELRQALLDLEGLDVPFFATLGERDVIGEAAYLAGLGASSFAFDVGVTRLIVLDSADATLAPDLYERLDGWLAPEPLWWSAEAPPTRLIITHTPPFDPFGSRGDGFKYRPEAGRLLAALSRAQVSALLTFHLNTWELQRLGALEVYHAGSGGQAPYYLRVDLSATCAPQGQRGAAEGRACDANTPCAARLTCVDSRCAPCLQIQRVDP